MTRTFAAYDIEEFKKNILLRLVNLQQEAGEDKIKMPVGIFLLVDKDHGGDATAEEISKRFELLDFESRNIIDFYFLGWVVFNNMWRDLTGYTYKSGLKFDLGSFENCRDALRNIGITQFGGNADLIIFDSYFNDDWEVVLDFTQVIHIDVSKEITNGTFSTLGSFLEKIIDVTEEIKEEIKNDTENYNGVNVTYQISNSLGIAFAKDSILEYLLDKFGKVIGGKRLAKLTTLRLGESVRLDEIGKSRPPHMTKFNSYKNMR